MTHLQIEDCYQTPAAPIGRDNTVLVRFNPQASLHVVNLTETKTLWQKSFTTDSDLRCSGLFDLEIKIQSGALVIGRHRISSRKLFKSSSLTRYKVGLLDESTGQRSQMSVEQYLPSFYPFIPMSIRVKIGDEVVFEQGRIPDTFWSLV